MGPQLERDAVIGRLSVAGPSAAQQKAKDVHEINEKDRMLKRRFFELEEKHNETNTEAQRSAERNARPREERNSSLDRSSEFETEQNEMQGLNDGSNGSPPSSSQPSSGGRPRTLPSAPARISIAGNLPQADEEDNAMLTSPHIENDARGSGHPEEEEFLDRSKRARLSSSPSDKGYQDSAQCINHDLQETRPTTDSGIPEPSTDSRPMLSPLSATQTHSNALPLPSTSSHSHFPPQSSITLPGPYHEHDENLAPSQNGAQALSSHHQDHHLHPPRANSTDVEMGDNRNSVPPEDMPPSSSDVSTSVHNQNREGNAFISASGSIISSPAPINSPGKIPSLSSSTKHVAKPRRSSRVVPATENPDGEQRDPNTKPPAKRAKHSITSPIPKARVTRSESAALAAAAAAAKAEADAASQAAPPEALVPTSQPTSVSTLNGSSPIAGVSSILHASSLLASSSRSNEEVQAGGIFPSSHSPSQGSTGASVRVTQGPPSVSAPVSAPPTGNVSETNSASTATSCVADLNIDPALSSSGSATVLSNMEKIVKVAEAAVAAQNASHKSTPSSSSLTPGTASGVNPLPSSESTSSNKPSANPYVPMSQPITSGAPGAPAVPMTLAMNPYAMYYTGGANAPAYPHPYGNPYYYLAGPVAGGSGMYPSGSNVAPPTGQRPSQEATRQPKQKRLKSHTVTSKSFSIPMVPRDKRGQPMLPLNVGIMTVINLGTVCVREHFHTERYIFPVGYEVSRRYLSTVDPSIEVVYHCTILDGGDGPKFQIIPSDVPDRPVIAGTATGAWSSIVKQANAIRNRQHSNSVSGPDFFGLGQNTIKHLIQELPNSDRLRDYVWQTFVEGGPLGGRHAAVIPALPEEYDSAMPISAYYSDKLKRNVTSTPETPKGLGHYPQHVQAEAQRQQSEQGGPPISVFQRTGVGSSSTTADTESTPRQVSYAAAPTSKGPSHSTRQSARLHPSSQQTYLRDVGTGVPPSAGSAPGEGARATFASLMSAFPTTGGPLPSQ